jgi:hypothetical protein
MWTSWCQITDAKAVEVRGMGLRHDSNEIARGHVQLRPYAGDLFEDGSVGWYEAGWGPMMSEMAFFVKDVMSPKGSVSILVDGPEREIRRYRRAHEDLGHPRPFSAETGPDGQFVRNRDEDLAMDRRARITRNSAISNRPMC